MVAINQLCSDTDISSADQMAIWSTANSATRKVALDVLANWLIANYIPSYLASLPKTDPHVLGSPWLNTGVVTVSQG